MNFKSKAKLVFTAFVVAMPSLAMAEDTNQNNQRKTKTEAFIDGVFAAADRAGRSSERGNDKAYNVASKLSRFIIRETRE